MISDFTPEQMFIQSNILYVSNINLSSLFSPIILDGQEMLSVDCKALWELLVTDNNKKNLVLHLDYPRFSEVISIEFHENDTELLISEQEFETLGILIDFNPETYEAKCVVFIPNIREGLNHIEKNE